MTSLSIQYQLCLPLSVLCLHCCVVHLTYYVYYCPAAPFCKQLIQGLESNPMFNIVWQGIKPLFIGKLLYTPDTPAVRQVMKQVQQDTIR